MLAMTSQRPANQLFVYVWPVHVGRIEKRDAEFERAMNGGN
jgi:hypothetical protein